MKAEYKKRFQKKCPIGIQREDLIKCLLYRIQEELYRPEKVKQELMQINDPAAYNKRLLETAVQGSTIVLADGTALEREYKGETAQRFLAEGQRLLLPDFATTTQR